MVFFFFLFFLFKDLQWTHQREGKGKDLPIRTLAQTFLRAIVRKGKNLSFSNLNPKEKKFFFVEKRKNGNKFKERSFQRIPSHVFFFRYKIQHRPPTRREPRILSIVFSFEQVPPGVSTWWTRLFLSRLPPSRVRRGAAGRREKKKSKHRHFFCTGMLDFLFYLEFEVVIRRFTFTSRKGNQLFSNFPLHIYFKERDKVLKCRERRFYLICRERQFCAVEGDFVP